jgi:hypothetical protein
MQYWSELERVDVHLTQYSTMETLNRVRVNLKHHGIMPAPSESISSTTGLCPRRVKSSQLVFTSTTSL